MQKLVLALRFDKLHQNLGPNISTRCPTRSSSTGPTRTSSRGRTSATLTTRRTRREDATTCLTFWLDKMHKIYTLTVANETVSALFRQRGDPSVDSITRQIISSFRTAIEFSPEVEDTLRRILKREKWLRASTLSRCRQSRRSLRPCTSGGMT